jgi:hypothetical protein
VSRDQDSFGAAQRRSSNDGIAVAMHGEMWQCAQRPLDRISNSTLRAADRRDITQGGGERRGVERQVERMRRLDHKVTLMTDDVGRPCYRQSRAQQT